MMLSNRIVRIYELSQSEIEVMYQLMKQYYDNIFRDKFLKDLKEKEGVLLVLDGNQNICGFTTYDLYQTNFQNECINVLYSGDTVIRKEYWGQVNTSKMFMSLLMKCKEECNGLLFWFLITKGIRTYRLLPLFFKNYYPSYHVATPEYEKNIIKHLARLQFKEYYIMAEGVIRFEKGSDCLKNEFCHIDKNKKINPHIQYFLKVNPGYISGDNLPCIAEIDLDNFTNRALKFIDNVVVKV
ncbi:MAG: hypothetical protein KC733_04550 [Candidatus Omnitrophica bacterium]|nr:hypothetical protein [Candidatus Omnitrophota bacterium]